MPPVHTLPLLSDHGEYVTRGEAVNYLKAEQTSSPVSQLPHRYIEHFGGILW